MRDALCKPVDPASFLVFRVAFGLLLLFSITRLYFKGFFQTLAQQQFWFPFLEAVNLGPLPELGMQLVFIQLVVSAVLITLGLYYRFGLLSFFLGFLYIGSIDKVHYQNHYYFILLLCLPLLLIPGKPQSYPRWKLWFLRFHVFLPYFFGGIAKLNGDWLQGQPLRIWLSNYQWGSESVAYLFSYGGLLLDLLVVPFLLSPRTRRIAFVVAVSFHLMNAYLFRIGVFPWLMIACTTLFFDPSWPRKWKQIRWPQFRPSSFEVSRYTVLLVVGYIAVHLLLPFRNHLYSGKTAWTEFGLHFTWRMKLADKKHFHHFIAEDIATGEKWEILPSMYLSPLQLDRMLGNPVMVRQFVDHVESLHKDKIRIFPNILVSLNARRFQPIFEAGTLQVRPLEVPLSSRLDENDAYWLLRKSRRLFQEGSVGESLSLLKKSARIDPNVPEVHFALAHVFKKLRDVESARASYEKGISLRPTDYRASLELASLLIANPQATAVDKRRALELSQYAIKVSRSLYVQPLEIYARCLLAMGRLGEAREVLGRAVYIAEQKAFNSKYISELRRLVRSIHVK